MKKLLAIPVAVLVFTACEDTTKDSATYTATGAPSGVTTGTTAGATTGTPGGTTGGTTTTGTTSGTTVPSVWTYHTGPCSGSGTSALQCDDADTCYVGCGETATGTGLFLTEDGGATFGAPPDQAGGFFGGYRVMHLSREGNLLYVAGTNTTSEHRVVSLDTTDGTLTEVYMNIANIDFSMTAGSYARTSDGTQVVESLTGNGIILQKDDGAWQKTHAANAGWASGYGWWLNTPFTSNVQVLDMGVVNDKIVGVGAQINEPPVVYLPPRSWTFGTDDDGDGDVDQLFETVGLTDGFSAYDGECWQIDGNSDGLAVVCVDQDNDRGMVYTIGPNWETDAYDLANWTASSASDVVAAALVSGHSTWNEGVCRGPNNELTVVGRDSQTDDGYAMRSTDGGATWSEIMDLSGIFGPITRCAYAGDRLIVSGSGLFASAAIADL